LKVVPDHMYLLSAALRVAVRDLPVERQQGSVVALPCSVWGRCSNGPFHSGVGSNFKGKNYLKGIFAAKKILISPGCPLVPGGSIHPVGAEALCHFGLGLLQSSHRRVPCSACDAAQCCGAWHAAGFIGWNCISNVL